MNALGWRFRLGIGVLLVALAGCGAVEEPAVAPDLRLRLLQNQPAVDSVEIWNGPLPGAVAPVDGLVIRTGHYRIYTTVRDGLLLKRIPVFLESCWQAYREQIEPGELPATEPLAVYLFDTRPEWEAFTRQWAGARAPSYLRIESGAYYLNGACVAYLLDRQTSFAVLAHEGWHQFSDRVFQYYLPAWLDEGLATFFEAHVWRSGRAYFVPAQNGWRLAALRQALARDEMYSLETLLTLDAGQAMDQAAGLGPEKAAARVAAFYAQVYAWNRFLREYDHCRHYLALRRLVYDGFTGRWPLEERDRIEARRDGQPSMRDWNRRVGPLLVARYLSGDLRSLQRDYLVFCRMLVHGWPDGR